MTLTAKTSSKYNSRIELSESSITESEASWTLAYQYRESVQPVHKQYDWEHGPITLSL